LLRWVHCYSWRVRAAYRLVCPRLSGATPGLAFTEGMKLIPPGWQRRWRVILDPL